MSRTGAIRTFASATEAGKAMPRLPVATAFHSPLVAASSAPFRDYLAGVAMTAPVLEVYSDTAAAPYVDPAPDAGPRILGLGPP